MAAAETGGFFKRLATTIRRAWYLSDIRDGRLVGTDQFGNKYYESRDPTREVYGRDRWIEPRVMGNYDASEVPCEWHMWLHHMTDVSPSARPAKPLKFTLEHQRNPSGNLERAHFLRGHFLNSQFKPFDIKEKVQPWQPPQPQAQQKKEDA